MNGFRERAKAHHDVSLLRRVQLASALKKADLAASDARIGRASVITAPTSTDAMQRLLDAYDVKARECEQLREAVRLACKVADNMEHAYTLLAKVVRARDTGP